MKGFNRTICLYVSVFLSVSFLIGLLIFFLPRIEFLYPLWVYVTKSSGLDKFLESMVLKENPTAYFNLAFFSIVNGAVITILSFGIFYWIRSLIIGRKIKKSEKKALKEKRVLSMKGDMK